MATATAEALPGKATTPDVASALAPIVERLDHLYQDVLDKIETQVAEAHSINDSITDVIGRTSTGESVLKWNPELAMSPKAAYRSFCEAVAKKAAPLLLGNSHQKSGYRYQDLIEWVLPATGPVLSHEEYQRFKMDYARSRSVRAFFNELLIRFHPQSFPEHAIDRATSEVARIFSVTTPIGTVIPITRGEAPAILSYQLYRNDDEMVWHMAERHYSAILKASNAIATIALLNSMNPASAAIGDLLNQLDAKMQKHMFHYESGDGFYAANFLRVVLRRDIAEFQFGETLFAILSKEIQTHVSDVRLINQ